MQAKGGRQSGFAELAAEHGAYVLAGVVTLDRERGMGAQ